MNTKIIQNKLAFGNYTKIYNENNKTINEHYNDNNVLLSRIEYDEFKRDIDAKEYNSFGIVTSHQQKKYYKTPSEEGFVETFKNKNQQYIRKSCTKIQDGLKHVIDDFKSLTSPNKSYVNDFVHDKAGKLIKIIKNGIESVL